MVKLTPGLMTVVPKIHRKVIKVANKRPGAIRTPAAVKREQIPVDPCENSNDSGLGFDHHLDYHTTLASHSALRFSDKETTWPAEELPEVKRRRLDIKLESDDANDNFAFQEAVRQQAPRTICMPVRPRPRVLAPLTLNSQLLSTSHDGLTQLLIVCQPEQQHRARYQTEGSRGAVKDRTGNGFPVVKLVGYDRPATLQVFIGTDQGRVAPHMFYQACRVSGKNSTPCIEKKIDGTIVIEVDIEPSKDMVVTCDCVGILKERNVDVEHRFPEEGSGRSKKKSTRCRMVFRTTITNHDGTQETLQVTSQPIVCTQPPGVPEICKKSLISCCVRGGQELFILGKNFLKDTRVVFQEGDSTTPSWSQSVQPDKEFLQQSHLVCTVPPYRTLDVSEPVSVRLSVESSGKASEPHTFLYLPDSLRPADNSVLAPEGNIVDSSVSSQGGSTAGGFPSHIPVPPPLLMPSETAAPFLTAQTSAGKEDKVHPVMLWNKSADVMMPPPPPGLLPISMRRSSVHMIVPDPLTPEELKQEVPEPIIDPAKPMANVSDLSSTQSPSMDTFRRFVSNHSLPSINVGNYLSNIECNSIYANKGIKPQLINEMPRIMIPSPTNVSKPIFSGDSSNLLTTVEPALVNQTASMQFESRNLSVNSTTPQSPQESMSVIVNSNMIQKTSPDSHMSQTHKQMSETQNGLDLLMSSGINKRTATATERLDAFVNSAAESHISPTPTSPIAMTSVVNESSGLTSLSEMVVNRSSDMNKLQETTVPPMMQGSPLPISPHTSPHRGTANMTEGSLCSLLNSPVQNSQQTASSQAQSVTIIQATLEQHLNNQNISTSQTNISNLVQSPPLVPANQAETFSNLQTSLGQQLSSHSVSSSHISHTGMNNIMQSTSQPSTNQVQSFPTSLEQQLSPPSVNSTQLNHSDLSNLLQPSPQVTLEQQISSHTITSTQINHHDLNSLIQSSTQDSRSEVQAMSTLQASLQHLSSQTVSSPKIIQSEPVQANNITVSSMNNVMQTSPHNSVGEIQNLSNLQASLEHHLSSRGISPVQTNHESLTTGNIALNGLNSTVPTSSQIQAAVSQAQALSNLQASFQHHLSAQGMGSTRPLLESVASTSHSPSGMNNSMESSSQISVSQVQTLSNLQMSLGHLTSQVLTSSQQNHESTAPPSITLSNSIQTAPQDQVISNFQTSLDHHLTSGVVMGSTESSQSVVSLERLSNPLQTSPKHSSSQSLSSFPSSVNHLSSEVLSSAQSNHAESVASNNLSINDSQTINLTSPISLMSSQPVNVASNTSSASSPVMLSPTSRRSPASVLTSPGISLSSTPTMALSPAMSLSPNSLTISNSQQLEANSTHMVLRTPPLLSSELSMNTTSSLPLASSNIQMQNTSLRPTSMRQFEQVASNMSQSIPVQVATMSQYEQHQELPSTNKDTERKEPTAYMMPSQAVIGQPLKPEVPTQVVKKCEEGMPLPHELTQMSEHDLISYINPSCFDTV